MKASYLPILAAVGFAMIVARPCAADQTVITATPQSSAQMSPPIDGAPPSYVWDGQEYVGKLGTKYYYLGPHNTWMGLDVTRQQRYQQWQQNNPNWQQNEIRNTHYQGHDQGQSPNQPMYDNGKNPPQPSDVNAPQANQPNDMTTQPGRPSPTTGRESVNPNNPPQQ